MRQENLFYNTINESGSDLKNSNQRVRTQNELIFDIFNDTKKPLSPVHVHLVFEAYHKSAPLTSIRRGITQLTSAGKLIKTSERVDGLYGKPNHKWKLA